MTKTRETDADHAYRGHVYRNILEFRLSPDILCASQFKTYTMEEDIGSRSSNSPLDDEKEELLRVRYGLAPAEEGQLLWRLSREKNGEGTRYSLMVHRSNESHPQHRQSNRIDEVLVCRSVKPMLARKVKGLWFKVETAGEYWRATVGASGT